MGEQRAQNRKLEGRERVFFELRELEVVQGRYYLDVVFVEGGLVLKVFCCVTRT